MPFTPLNREALRDAVSKRSRNNNQRTGEGNGESTERTRLLGNPLRHGNGGPREHGTLYKVLIDSRDTPGRDSPKPWVKWPARVFQITKATLYSNYINVLLVFVPVGIIAGVTHWDPVVVFAINFLAIIPLAAVLSFATEEISVKLGDSLGGLLNATFGNAVELIVSIIALRDNQIAVVQSSMLGSILSNLLLVMGMCFFFGGITNMRDANGQGMEQSFASVTAQTTCSLMTLAAASMVIPGALGAILDKNKEHAATTAKTILILSRGTAIILLLLYVLYLWFQLRTHSNLFVDAESDTPAASTNAGPDAEEEEEEEEEKHMSPWSAGIILVVTTVLVAICADYLVDSIDAIVERVHISKNFIGLILIPIVGNAAEHVTAVVVAIKNKMDLALGVAIGSSIQIAMFVTPFLVILGWTMGREMTLRFETFETVAFALSVLVVTYTVQDGKSNYLEGAMLMGLYIIIAVAFFAMPEDAIGKVSLSLPLSG